MRVAMTSNLVEAFLAVGELRSLILGWFLWAPTALLVPALGWLNAPLTPRLALGFGLGLAAAPRGPAAEGSFWVELGRALLLGGVVAVGVAAVFWAALMAGGVADRVWPGRSQLEGPRSEGGAEVVPQGPMSLLLCLLTALFFLAGGGPSRVSAALTDLAWSTNGGYAQKIADTCVASITLAVTVATPVLLATLLLEGVTALIARSAPSLIVDTLLGPLKALAFLFLLALAIHPMTAMLVEALG